MRRRRTAWLAAIAAIFSAATAFNLDDAAPIYKFGPDETNFGFSVAEHIRGKEPVIIVGAPHDENGQMGTKQAGATYACPLNTEYLGNSHGKDSKWCQKMFVEYEDRLNYNKAPDMTTIVGTDTLDRMGKNGQLLGSAVYSAGVPGGNAVVCAPLLRYRNESARAQGACYLLHNNLELMSTLITCEQKNLDHRERHNTYGACMQGQSAYIDENMLITGVIGARMWTGGVYARSITKSDFDTVLEKYTMSQENAIRPTLQSHAYLGYSVNVGRFGFSHENGKRLTVVSGATRHNQFGAVQFMPFDLEHQNENDLKLNADKFSLEGKTFGSNFGYAIAVLDLNADGFDDLVVSAPMEQRNDKDGQFGGIVYVYFSQGKERPAGESKFVFEKPVVLKHSGYGSQFGLALTRLGNVHGSKRSTSDFAVGAPFANDGAGAVYIYHGNPDRKNFRQKPAQIIIGSALPPSPLGKPIKTFGFSLSGGTDLDANGYPDLVVGAYKSNLVTVLRARPVISVQAGQTTTKEYIDIDSKGRCPSGVATCFDLTLSLIVEGGAAKKHLVDYKNDVFICNLEVLPFAPGIAPRATIRSSHSPHNHTWPCGKNAHTHTQDYVKQIDIPDTASTHDWINPLKFRFTVRIKDEKKPVFPRQGGPLADLNQYPILNKFGSTYEFQKNFDTRCGMDHVCQTDLSLGAEFDNVHFENGQYISKVGEKDHLDIKFEVLNKGEKAYQAHLNLTYDTEELELPRLQSIANLRGITAETGKNFYLVQLGNPLDGGAGGNFVVRFKIMRGRTEGIGRPLQFKAYLNSTSKETNPHDNKWEGEVRLFKEAELELIGMSDPNIVRFGGVPIGTAAMQMEEDIGVMLRHNYTLHNKGPWTVRNVTVEFQWPYQVQSTFRRGKYALYLLDVPTVVNYNVLTGTTDVKQCIVERALEHVNPEEIPLNTRYSVEVNQPRKHHVIKRSVEGDGTPTEGRPITAGLWRISPEKRMEGDVEVDVVSIDCKKGTAKCFTVQCHFDFLDAGSAPVIDFRARLWNATFIEDYSDVEYVELLSTGRILVDHNQGILDDHANNEVSVATLAYPDRPALDETGPIPWSIILWSILAGLIILALIVFCFWRCGFFKRKRHNEPSLHRAELTHEREQWSEM
ncbi:unnamed protein product, partial [Mesorhabditis spiculigera]